MKSKFIALLILCLSVFTTVENAKAQYPGYGASQVWITNHASGADIVDNCFAGFGLGFNSDFDVCVGGVSQTAHLFLDIGNSHEIGRATALGTDAFDDKVYQWTQAGALEQPAAAMLDHQNDVPTDISPSLSFSDAYITRNPEVTRIVHVPHAQGSTGFSGGQWASDDVPNDLSQAVTRFNAAHAALVADGFTVTSSAVFYHANRPDFDNNTIPQLQVDIDAMIDYLRANLTDGANIPVIIGGGMTQTQLTSRAIENDLGFQGVMDGSYIRKTNVGSYDWINQRYGSNNAGLPAQTDDGVHVDRLGTITQGGLMDEALIRAQANTAPNDPFESLASWSEWDGFHDFRSGTGLDFSGNGNDLIQADAVTNLALTKFDTSNANTFVFDRDDGDTDRYWHVGAPLGASYTKAVMLRFDDLGATEGIWQNSDQGTRFFYTVGSNEIRAYHDSSSQRVTISGDDITLNQWHMIVVTYDEPTTTMRIYLDGVLIDTNTNVAAHPAVVNEALGAQNLTAQRPFRGGMLFAAYADTVIDQTAITSLNTAAQSILVVIPPPPAITDLSEIPGIQRHHDVSVSSSITHVAGSVSQLNDLSGNDYHLSQGVASRQPTYDATTNSLLFERSQSNRLIGDGAFMYNSPNGGTIIAVVDYLSLMNADTLASEYSSTTSAYYSIARLRGDTTPTPQSGDDAGSSVINDNRLTSIDVVAAGQHVYAQHIDQTLVTCDVNDVAGDTPQALDRTGHTLTLDRFTIGSRRGNERFPHMRLYELASWDRKLTETEYTQAYNLLALKWGINP